MLNLEIRILQKKTVRYYFIPIRLTKIQKVGEKMRVFIHCCWKVNWYNCLGSNLAMTSKIETKHDSAYIP